MATELPRVSCNRNKVVKTKCVVNQTRYSRLTEKTELQNLNDRLASYIDCVRYLETENSRLLVEMQSMKESITRETSGIKSIYEYELCDARKLLDEIASEKAKLEIDTKRLWEENDELKAKCGVLKKNLNIVKSELQIEEMKFTDLQAKCNQANVETKKAKSEANKLELEIDALHKQLDELRRNLDSEILVRVQLENANQSLREELTFKDQVHSRELNESRAKEQVEMNEIDRHLYEKYETKLQNTLHELREQYESQLHSNRNEIVTLYENKCKNLQNAVNHSSVTANKAIEELRLAHARIESLNSRENELENQNTQLTTKVRELEELLHSNRVRNAESIAGLEAEINRQHEEMELQLQEYQDLMDVKVLLDMEIAAYDQLLKGEESRLQLKELEKK